MNIEHRLSSAKLIAPKKPISGSPLNIPGKGASGAKVMNTSYTSSNYYIRRRIRIPNLRAASYHIQENDYSIINYSDNLI